MIRPAVTRRCLVLAALALGAGVVVPAPATPAARSHTLVLGRVADEPSEHIGDMDMLGTYLADRLAAAGYAGHRVVIARDTDEMTRLLRAGEVDIVSETVFAALRFEREAGAEILMREWRKGVPSYRTLFVTRRDSDIATLADLAGRTVAFEDAGSTSGFFLPMHALHTAGLNPVPADAEAEAGPDAVRYRFAEAELNVLAWTSRGRTDAGTLSNLEWAKMADRYPALHTQLRVFHETPPILRAVVVVRAGLDENVKDTLAWALGTMRESPAGADVLETIGVGGYDAIAGQAASDLQYARSVLQDGIGS